MGIYSEYLRILHKELNLKANPHQEQYTALLSDPARFANIARRILEVAKNSAVLRCCGPMGHLTNDVVAYESDGGHTNLVREIADCLLDFLYGWGEDPPTYTRYEISKAITWHDLPENETGDLPDNGTRDPEEKAAQERSYLDDYAELHDDTDSIHCFYIKRLIEEMRDQSTEEGRVLYLADKLTAVIMNLAYDSLYSIGLLAISPRAYPSDPWLSETDLAKMKKCQAQEDGGYLLSEVWTNDFLFARELTKYDDTGFFTALLIMTTLLVHGKWYTWREEHYLP